MRVLIACEFSGVVREAFRKLGHTAFSCDLLPAADGSKFHYEQNCLDVIERNEWDLIIAHPPCTYLAVSGARWWKDRQEEQKKAIEFFTDLDYYPHRKTKVCIENPIGIMSTKFRKPDQIMQPWMFGHGETKATCLWLKGLPKLKASNVVEGRVARVHRESPGVVGGLTRQQRRSITYQGIADAMAQQWGTINPSATA